MRFNIDRALNSQSNSLSMTGIGRPYRLSRAEYWPGGQPTLAFEIVHNGLDLATLSADSVLDASLRYFPTSEHPTSAVRRCRGRNQRSCENFAALQPDSTSARGDILAHLLARMTAYDLDPICKLDQIRPPDVGLDHLIDNTSPRSAAWRCRNQYASALGHAARP